ncbi:hypothetical protein PISMIDRAFT_11362 [Pisolithus microcarpus 441]|uniref:Uncharacterized protein n=1 Tax=Pisolithus microcarpus 441 TaxID=765257 RepID=A0A0C9YDA5_9AGAM|nr:hypothetical protein PISMIDRAFT_11362 [Pisolithus microcarpus 441]
MSEGELDLEAQRAALTSWNAVQRLALESESDQPGPLKSKSQRRTVMPEKSDYLQSTDARVEPRKGKEKRKRDKKRTKKATEKVNAPLNPIEGLIDKVTCRDHKHRERQQTPKAMEPTSAKQPFLTTGRTVDACLCNPVQPVQT